MDKDVEDGLRMQDLEAMPKMIDGMIFFFLLLEFGDTRRAFPHVLILKQLCSYVDKAFLDGMLVLAKWIATYAPDDEVHCLA